MDFIKNNWIHILTILIGLYGSILSTYLAFKNRIIIKLSFEFGILPVKNKKMIPYGSIYIKNLSNKKLFIKNYGFVSENGLIADIKILPNKLTSGLIKATTHKKQTWPPITTNEKIKIADSDRAINPSEGLYVFYDLDDIKRFILKNNVEKVYCFLSTHKKMYRRKIKLKELMSLETRDKVRNYS
jgi:hypothetical protein